jgi:hypothetical protein
MGSASELSAASIVAAARSARADAVLVTQVVDVETQNRDPTAAQTQITFVAGVLEATVVR